jgi:hypothetical protein
MLICSTYFLRIITFEFLPELVEGIYVYSPFDTPYALTSLFSVLIAVFFTILFNAFNDDIKYIKKSIKDVGNEFESLMKYSFNEESLLQFTLGNGKTYIAWVKELPIPSVSQYIRVIPAISGFRNSKGEVEFTTHYLTVYASYIEEGIVKYVDDLNTDLIIDITKIVSVSNFDPEMYKKFKERGTN